MTNSTPTLPAPSWLRDLANGRAEYEELLGWPVSLKVRSQNLVVAVGHVVDAVSMPAGLGARVRNEWTIDSPTGPIVADPGGTRWTFLTRPVRAIRGEIAADLAAWQVDLAPFGTHLAIPVTLSCTTENTWRWIERPMPNRPLPSTRGLVDVTRRLMDHQYLALGA